MEHDDVRNDAARTHRPQQPLVIPPVAHVEAREVERALGSRAAGAALTAPGCGVRGDGAGDDLVGSASLDRVGVVVDIPLGEDGHAQLVEDLAAAAAFQTRQRPERLVLHGVVFRRPLEFAMLG